MNRNKQSNWMLEIGKWSLDPSVVVIQEMAAYILMKHVNTEYCVDGKSIESNE